MNPMNEEDGNKNRPFKEEAGGRDRRAIDHEF